MADRFGNVLIVGGTGIMADASRFVAARADRVVLGARHPHALAQETGAIPWVLDWTNQCDTLGALVPMPAFDLVISWLHLNGMWLAEHLESKLSKGGHSLRVHGQAAAIPATLARRSPALRSGISRQDVILGRMVEAGYRRWLTNAEISRGVIEALDSPTTTPFAVGDITPPELPAQG